jgi:hypothetical protein
LKSPPVRLKPLSPPSLGTAYSQEIAVPSGTRPCIRSNIVQNVPAYDQTMYRMSLYACSVHSQSDGGSERYQTLRTIQQCSICQRYACSVRRGTGYSQEMTVPSCTRPCVRSNTVQNVPVRLLHRYEQRTAKILQFLTVPGPADDQTLFKMSLYACSVHRDSGYSQEMGVQSGTRPCVVSNVDKNVPLRLFRPQGQRTAKRWPFILAVPVPANDQTLFKMSLNTCSLPGYSVQPGDGRS